VECSGILNSPVPSCTWKPPAKGYTHGVKFGEMTPAQQTALTDYLCQVEWQYRMAL
jgi:hypothetical protein